MANTIIYKYPKLIDLIETYQDENYNPIFHNPHFNLIEYARNNNYVPPWCFSIIPSNEAINMMIEKPELVDFQYLMRNTNPRIRLLLENRTSFSRDEWDYMSSSRNSYIMELLEQNLDNINWEVLSYNKHEGAIRILKNNPDKIYWRNLMGNTAALEIFKEHQDKIIWNSKEFCSNPSAIELIEKMVHQKKWKKINFIALSANPNAIHILKQHMNKVAWDKLSKNPNAIDILMEHPEMISFTHFLQNPNAIPYIETVMEKQHIDNLDIVRISYLFYNQNCIPLIQKWWDEGRITRENIIDNIYNIYSKSVYECDFQEMSKKRCKIIYEELIAKAFHPSRVEKWLEYHINTGGDINDFDMC